MVSDPRWIGILFQDPLVRAIRREVAPKTVTRRAPARADRWAGVQPGDRLWVREAWNVGSWTGGEGYRSWFEPTHRIPKTRPAPEDAEVIFRADGFPATADDPSYRPSIHMPRWASRISLEVVSVRKERGWVYAFAGGERVPLPMVDDEEARREGVADRAAFLELWRQINGPEYPSELWRIEFRRIVE